MVLSLRLKSDVFSTFVTFKNVVENMFNAKIKAFQRDGDGEFINHSFQKKI